MSMLLMVAAMKAKLGNPIRKLVLIKLADNANDDGMCWPSYRHIADHCEIDRKTAIRHIEWLEANKFLTKQYRKDEDCGNKSNVYRIDIDGGIKSLGVQNPQGSPTKSPPPSPTESPRTSHSLEPVNEPVIYNGTSHDAPCDRTGNESLQVPVVNSQLTPDRPKKKTKLDQTIELIRDKHLGGLLINIDENLLADWIKHKKYPTARVIAAMERELQYCADAGISPTSAVEQQLERSWTGFKADWLIRERNQAAFNTKNNEPVEDWTEALRRGDYL